MTERIYEHIKIADWSSGAHYGGLENHNCRTESIRLPMSGEALEGILRGTSATVCCAAYDSYRPKTFVVNMDNCNQGGSHFIFLY